MPRIIEVICFSIALIAGVLLVVFPDGWAYDRDFEEAGDSRSHRRRNRGLGLFALTIVFLWALIQLLT